VYTDIYIYPYMYLSIIFVSPSAINYRYAHTDSQTDRDNDRGYDRHVDRHRQRKRGTTLVFRHMKKSNAPIY